MSRPHRCVTGETVQPRPAASVMIKTETIRCSGTDIRDLIIIRCQQKMRSEIFWLMELTVSCGGGGWEHFIICYERLSAVLLYQFMNIVEPLLLGWCNWMVFIQRVLPEKITNIPWNWVLVICWGESRENIQTDHFQFMNFTEWLLSSHLSWLILQENHSMKWILKGFFF